MPPDTIPKIIEFMLYYGFLGVKVSDESSRFIFDVGYEANEGSYCQGKRDGITCILNPAFHAALNL